MTNTTDIKNEEADEKKSPNFTEQAVGSDLKAGKSGGRAQTRLPPEPNSYLHIGHIKAICLDFGIAVAHSGVCNLCFDDTNPMKEDMEYVEAMQEDIQRLGLQWDNIYYASDYPQQLWDFVVTLIKGGKACIDEQISEQITQQEGTPTQPGVGSSYRNHSTEESLALFEKMNSNEAREDSMILRVKVDVASPNTHLRGPIMYRILHVAHHRTGTQWEAYPMYDFVYSQSDYLEGVTRSFCTLEFIPHRPLCDLFIGWLERGKDLDNSHPRQTESNKLSLNHTLMSKHSLLILVKEGLVNDWGDSRMPIPCGFRCRGYSPKSIREFTDKIGYTTYGALNDLVLLESVVCEGLNARATRVPAVLNPMKPIITNYPKRQVEELNAISSLEGPTAESHTIEFSRELWIEREDFMEDAPKKYFRMTPGQEVHLKNAYIVKCTGCKRDGSGTVTEVYYKHDLNTKSNMPDANRKVKGMFHQVSCIHCPPAEVRLYDRPWKVENPRDEIAAIRETKGCDALEAMREMINPDPLTTLTRHYTEKYVADLPALSYLQFQHTGYLDVDKDSTFGHLVLNRTVGLEDT